MTSILEDDTEEKGQVAPRTIGEQPGGLRSETRMTIQTRQAQKIVVGRRSGKGVQQIIGLLNFGRRMKLLWLSAQADDPYADWYLLRIEDAINEAKVVIREKKQWLDNVLNSMEGFDVGIAHSLEPIQVSIVFQNPYGYMGAYLVADYDALCCSVFTASHIGLIDRKTANNIMGAAGKSLRRTFDLVAQWKFTGVTREDIQVKNPSGIRAIETYGECPEPVLAKTKRATISPEIREKPKPVEVNVKKKEVKAENSNKIASEEKSESENSEAGPVSLQNIANG
jgi:integrating conjugative element protein (TIGR03761 family)